MKRLLLTSVAIVLSFAAGVVTLSILTKHRSGKSPTPGVPVSTSYRYPSKGEVIATGRYVVIAIPNDREFYIGKNSISLSDIPDRVRQLVGDLPADQRTVFVKGEPNVRYETLSSVIDKIHDADVARIEFVLDRKKSLR